MMEMDVNIVKIISGLLQFFRSLKNNPASSVEERLSCMNRWPQKSDQADR